MKKTLISVIIVIFIVAGIAYLHYVNKPPQVPPGVSEAPFSPDVPTGEPVTIELKYRGITGQKDDLRVYGRYGFGSSTEVDSAFIDAVKAKTDNPIFISRNPYLPDRQYTAVEYKGQEIVAVYFDLNGDNALADDEKLLPAKVSEENRRGDNTTVFLTPDFTVTSKDGRKVPFRVILWVNFYGDSTQPYVTWWPMGVYEGTAKVAGEKMRFYLFPDFFEQSYSAFGSSNYAMVPTSNKDQYLPRRSLSSLIAYKKIFYRLAVKADENDPQRLSVVLAEDKSPRGRIAFDLQGGEDFKSNLNNATLQGAKDKSIYFSISRGMEELPVGEYMISSGYVNYGKEKPDGYSTSFSKVPAFTVKDEKTTTIELGKPQPKIGAVELSNRYNSDKKYKTEFPEGTPVYLDLTFTGMAGETYSGFRQRVQKENYTTSEYMKAHLEIVDAQNNKIVSEDMEYG